MSNIQTPKTTLPNYSPETIDELVWMPYRSDDGFSQRWYGHGVEDGEITSVDCDDDGNWETDGWGEAATEENLGALHNELWERHEEAVAWYDQHCLKTGDDPLHAYYVRHTTKVKSNYIAYATPWIGAPQHGMAVTSIRGPKTQLGGKTLADPSEAPQHLRDFLQLERIEGGRYCMEGIKTREDICGDNVGCVGDHDAKGGIYIKFQVDWERPRPAAKVKADIRRIARRSIERRSSKK